MKPAFFIFFSFIFSYTAFAQTAKEDFDYSIVFGGCFDKDIVSLKINNVSIFNDYKVDNKNALKKGNLSLTQTDKKINVFYNGQQKSRRKVKFNFSLDIELVVNNQAQKFKVDLRKGKVILIEFCPAPQATPQTAKKLTIEQVQDQVIFM